MSLGPIQRQSSFPNSRVSSYDVKGRIHSGESFLAHPRSSILRLLNQTFSKKPFDIGEGYPMSWESSFFPSYHRENLPGY